MGSEMCIRDRLRLVSAIFELHEDLALVTPATDVGGGSPGSSAEPGRSRVGTSEPSVPQAPDVVLSRLCRLSKRARKQASPFRSLRQHVNNLSSKTNRRIGGLVSHPVGLFIVLSQRLLEKCAGPTALPFDDVQQPRVGVVDDGIAAGHLHQSVHIRNEEGSAQEAQDAAHKR